MRDASIAVMCEIGVETGGSNVQFAVNPEDGRLVVIGFAGGTIPSVAANRILLKNIEVTGLHWGAYAQNQPTAIPEVFRALFDLYDAGKIRPLIFRAYPLEDAGQALLDLGSRKTWGKVVLAP